MSRFPRTAAIVPLCALPLLTACITTPASETGWTKRARVLVPRACGEAGLIEDGEDGDTQVLVRDGRGGYWFTFVDSHGSKVQPQPFKLEGPGRNGSRHAARMHGKMASSAPGVYPYAGIGFSLADPRGAYDARRYKGISFWAKGPGHVRFEMPDGYTSPEGGWCTDCYNDFSIELALTAEWEQYTILFEWLQQRPNWGDTRPAIASEKLFAAEWEYSSSDREYDVWIDDIAFVCGVEGERP